MTGGGEALTKEEILGAVRLLPPEARARALRRALELKTRELNSLRYPTPGDLAVAVDRKTVQTPALRLIDEKVAEAVENGGRLIISVPPQEGKSTRVAVWTPVWALMRNPEWRVVVGSYAESLARRNAMQARSLINEFGSGAVDGMTGAALPDYLGIRLADDHKKANSWAVADAGGGYYATGTGGSLTGRSADLLIIDDPVKNMVEADSSREREKVWEWWTSVAQTRLAPGAAVVIIMTRWHEDDLAGRILKEDRRLPAGERVWDVVNIPAVAEDGVRDSLNRPAGEPLESARGRTLNDFITIKSQVGERVWSALYQGNPTPLEGGLFSRREFDATRGEKGLPMAGRIITVDPSESGHGDEAGVLVMGWDEDGITWVCEDHSRPMKSSAWADLAVRLALRHGAGDLLYEAFTAKETYQDVLERAWREIASQADYLRRYNFDPAEAAYAWHADGGGGDSLGNMQKTLEVIGAIREGDSNPPFRIVPWRAKGDKVARAAGARQAASTGRLRMAGRHTVLENQAVTWQPGQGSPDRVDAMVNGFEHIQKNISAGASVAFPGEW